MDSGEFKMVTKDCGNKTKVSKLAWVIAQKAGEMFDWNNSYDTCDTAGQSQNVKC